MSLEKEKDITKNAWKKDSLDMDNIFWDDFWWDLDFWNDIKEIDEKISKDIYYYIWLIWNIIWYINILAFIFIFTLAWYIYIQSSDKFYRSEILNWVCWYLLPEEAIESWQNCSWVKSLLLNLDTSVSKIADIQFEKIYTLLPNIYSLENFLFTKEVQFLLIESQEKVPILDMLNEFDDLLKWFYSVDKWQIECDGIQISSDNVLTTNCTVFASDWNTEIMWPDWTYLNKTSGSTISLASSFLNYIQKESKSFNLVTKQKIFTKDLFDGNWFYTSSTSFKLSLKYSDSWSINF